MDLARDHKSSCVDLEVVNVTDVTTLGLLFTIYRSTRKLIKVIKTNSCDKYSVICKETRTKQHKLIESTLKG